MAEALTQKRIEALAKKRPATKKEFADGGQRGLYLVAGPRSLKWLVRYRSPATGANRKLAIGEYGSTRPALGLHDARKLAEAKLAVVAQGHDPAEEHMTAARRHHTVTEAFEDFVDRYSKIKNKASTSAETARFIEREILPAWGRRKLSTITRRDIVALVDGIAEGRSGAAPRPQSAVRVRALLSKSFGWFAAKGLLPENPFRDIEVPAPPRTVDRVLSDDEIRWLWSATAEMGWPFGDLARLLLLTAQRRDEVAKARWAEFDEAGSVVSWTIPGERTKNSRSQTLILPDQVVDILRRLPRVVGESESAYLLSTNGRTPISGYSRAKARIDAKMMEIARAETADPSRVIPAWTFHDLRRTAATGMAGLGLPVHVVEQVLNHKSGSISGVAAIYNRHSYALEKRDALSAWADRLGILIGEKQMSNVVPLKARQPTAKL